MAPRKATPGGDVDIWGEIVNDYLATEHDARGKHKRPMGPPLIPKGEKATTGDLPAEGETVGELWTVAGEAWSWNGTAWVSLGPMAGLQQAVADTMYPDKAATEAAIARHDPGTAGAVGQYVTIGPSGPAWLNERVFNVKHPRFGAVGDNTTNDRAAIQAAIDAAQAAGGGTVFFPTGNYLAAGGLTVSGNNITLLGESWKNTMIRSNTSDVIILDGATYFRCEDLNLRSSTGGGHLFRIASSVSRSVWSRLYCDQRNAGKSVLYGDDTVPGESAFLSYIHNEWRDIETVVPQSATVAAFHLRGQAVNRNRWSGVMPNNSGNYVWRIESTSAGSYAYNNTIEAVTGEVLNGGVARLLGTWGTRLVGVEIYDLHLLGPTTRDLFVIGDSASGLSTRNTLFDSCRRNGGTLGAGLYDVVISTAFATTGTTFLNCGGSTNMTVNANNKRFYSLGSLLTVTNGSNETRVSETGSGSRFARIAAFAGGVTLEGSAAPATPAANSGVLYVESGVLKYKDSTGATYTVNLTAV